METLIIIIILDFFFFSVILNDTLRDKTSVNSSIVVF